MLLATALVAIVFWQANVVLTEQVVATLGAEADALENEGKAGRAGLIEAVSARSRPEGPGLYILVDSKGRKLAGNLSRVPPEVATGSAGGVFKYRPVGQSSQDMPPPERLAVARQLQLRGGEQLVVGRDVEDQRRYADGVKRLVIGGFVALALVGLGAAAVISRLVLKRIEAMNTAASRIMAGDFAERVPVDGSGDELDGLAHNLNAMLERIVELMAGLREVSDNIAHDLKTPLNRLRNRVEGALRQSEPKIHREALERTIEEADELIRTFNALLLIARLESSAVEDSASDVDLGKLVSGVVEFYAPVAEEAGTRLELSALPVDRIMITANGSLLQQAIANLVDNALKYGCASGAAIGEPVRIAVSADAKGIEIRVADRGPGIPAVDRERALRRFVRLDESRSQPGTGLGLSLVAAVARLHGGQVVLKDTLPGDKSPGLAVCLRLPARLVPPYRQVARPGELSDNHSGIARITVDREDGDCAIKAGGVRSGPGERRPDQTPEVAADGTMGHKLRL